MKVFISGSKSVTALPSVVTDYLLKLMHSEVQILIGDCSGVDLLIQNYFKYNNYTKVTIYYSGYRLRNDSDFTDRLLWSRIRVSVPSNIPHNKFYTIKDTRMSDECDYGLVIWDGKSKGSKSNIDYLRATSKSVIIYRIDLNKWIISKGITK